MSVGVFTPELRFKWVKGQVTSGEPDAGFVACGDRTDFPMEVTGATVREKLDKIAEIFYRAKCWKFTEGHVSAQHPNARVQTLAFNGIAPSVAKFFTTESETQYSISPHLYYDEPPLGFEQYFSDGYESGLGSSFNDFTLFDAVTEYAIFVPWQEGDYRHLSLSKIFGFITKDADGNLLNPGSYGINLSGDFDEDPAWVAAEASIIPLIAFTGDDGPYHADSRLFLNVSFYMSEEYGPYIFCGGEHGLADIDDIGVNFVMRLSSGDLTTRLYAFSGWYFDSASDCVITPFRWWPYAKDSPAVPVWNADTGERL